MYKKNWDASIKTRELLRLRSAISCRKPKTFIIVHKVVVGENRNATHGHVCHPPKVTRFTLRVQWLTTAMVRGDRAAEHRNVSVMNLAKGYTGLVCDSLLRCVGSVSINQSVLVQTPLSFLSNSLGLALLWLLSAFALWCGVPNNGSARYAHTSHILVSNLDAVEKSSHPNRFCSVQIVGNSGCPLVPPKRCSVEYCTSHHFFLSDH